MAWSHLFAFVMIPLLLLCSALASGAEVAFFSLSPKQKEQLSNEKSKTNQTIIGLLEKPQQLLVTILIANTLFNISIIILSTWVTLGILQIFDHALLTFIVQVVGITFVILLFGEVLPKAYATKHTIGFASLTAFPLLFLSKAFSPVSNLLIYSTTFFHKKLRKKSHSISADELSKALELTSGDSPAEQHDILEGIIQFGKTDVRQIMKPRMDISAIDQNMDFRSVLAIVREWSFSRIPVYKENLDKIAGILYIKDLLPHLDKDEKFRWQELIRPPLFVPENKKIGDLLTEMQDKKVHIAVVVDEYNGTAGIVTLEDIIEEIVGEISDESDVQETNYSRIDPNNFVFNGDTNLNDIYRIMEIESREFDIAKGDSETLAGFLLELTGKIPQVNEKIIFKKFIFTIEEADNRQLKRIRVTVGKTKDIG